MITNLDKKFLTISLFLLSQFAFGEDFSLSIKGVPDLKGTFSEVFNLVCKADTCQVNNSGLFPKQGNVSQKLVQDEINKLLESKSSELYKDPTKRPQKILRHVSYQSKDKTFEIFLGDLFNKNNKDPKNFQEFNRKLDKVIHKALAGAK